MIKSFSNFQFRNSVFYFVFYKFFCLLTVVPPPTPPPSPLLPELQRMLIGKNNEARFFRKIGKRRQNTATEAIYCFITENKAVCAWRSPCIKKKTLSRRVSCLIKPINYWTVCRGDDDCTGKHKIHKKTCFTLLNPFICPFEFSSVLPLYLYMKGVRYVNNETVTLFRTQSLASQMLSVAASFMREAFKPSKLGLILKIS